jgi:hypothetical protein
MVLQEYSENSEFCLPTAYISTAGTFSKSWISTYFSYIKVSREFCFVFPGRRLPVRRRPVEDSTLRIELARLYLQKCVGLEAYATAGLEPGATKELCFFVIR